MQYSLVGRETGKVRRGKINFTDLLVDQELTGLFWRVLNKTNSLPGKAKPLGELPRNTPAPGIGTRVAVPPSVAGRRESDVRFPPCSGT